MASSGDPSVPASQELSADMVGGAFVRQYYTLLSLRPEQLYRLYSQDSVMLHAVEGSDGSSNITVSGDVAIGEKIVSLDFANCNAMLSFVDTQESLNGGFVVLVSGTLSKKGAPARRFVQTFVLAKQGSHAFYVRNDVFRYLSPVSPPQPSQPGDAAAVSQPAPPTANGKASAGPKSVAAAAPAATTATATTATAATTKSAETAAAPSKPAAVSPAAKPAAAASAPAPAKPPAADAAKPASKPAAADAVSAPAPAPKAPTSWAAIAGSNAAAAVPAPKPAAAAPAAPAPAPAAAVAAAPAGNGTVPQGNGTAAAAAEKPTVILKNLPFGVEREALEAAFERFGAITGMNLRPGRSFAYIDFATKEAMLAAVAEGQVKVAGRPVTVEKKDEERARAAAAKRKADAARAAPPSRGNARGSSRGTMRGGVSRGRGRGSF